jgi:Fe-S cluster biosynthesis and repair protein YggX
VKFTAERILKGPLKNWNYLDFSSLYPNHLSKAFAHLQFTKEIPMARTVQCIKLGKEAEGLDFPPYPGELGKRIWESVSKEAWAGWLKHQTMLVNENRLNLADARARQYLARQMENHFFGGGADAAAGYVPPSA